MMIFLGLKKWKASIKHTLIYVFEPSYKFCTLVIDVVYQVASQNKAISQPNCFPWKILWDKSVDRLFTGGISGNHTTHSFSVRGLILAREIGIYSSCIGSTKKPPKNHKPKTTHRTKKLCCSAFLLVCHVSCQQPCLEDLTPRCWWRFHCTLRYSAEQFCPRGPGPTVRSGQIGSSSAEAAAQVSVKRAAKYPLACSYPPCSGSSQPTISVFQEALTQPSFPSLHAVISPSKIEWCHIASLMPEIIVTWVVKAHLIGAWLFTLKAEHLNLCFEGHAIVK